ncbi:hypothetical protein WR25_22455 [Diploscapter pachys]|uniref:T-box domain-containing protein n=1 Tax=Diploscapter pachys TaxID=2018661 RepID=A0A2A2KDC2_9BILA|nr:hypothetical protein WR25_22455 [Diploscapter pachys]
MQMIPMKDEQQLISFRLVNDNVWRDFHKFTNEMIVTKPGRKMFPKYEFHLQGLDPNGTYSLEMVIQRVDNNRYKFANAEWTVSGQGEPRIEQRSVWHTEREALGSTWMSRPVSFDFVKLTNNIDDTESSHVILQSMHKYMPIIQVHRIFKPQQFYSSDGTSVRPYGHSYIASSLKDPNTEFIAVTAYQNNQITKLKILHNPFAKGFREGGERGTKRRSATPSTGSSSSEPSPKGTPNPSQFLPFHFLNPHQQSTQFPSDPSTAAAAAPMQPMPAMPWFCQPSAYYPPYGAVAPHPHYPIPSSVPVPFNPFAYHFDGYTPQAAALSQTDSLDLKQNNLM